jgi:hypothetical protein
MPARTKRLVKAKAMAFTIDNASHNGIAHVAFDHENSLRSREFIISWLTPTPHATAVYRFMFGVTAASRNTRFQAAR